MVQTASLRAFGSQVSAAAAIVLSLGLLAFVTLQPREVFDAHAVDSSNDHLWLTVEHEGATYQVDIHFLTGESSSDLDAAHEAALARFAEAGISATVIEDHAPGTVAAQFAKKSYWWSDHTTEWKYNPAGKPDGLAGDAEAIAAAASTWATAGAGFAFVHEGATMAATGACGEGIDGQNTVGWADIPGNVLAVTCTWYSGGTSPTTAIEFDMEIDRRWVWTSGAPVEMDLQSVATHEFGHALGLGHASESGSVMFATYPSGALKHDPTPDDRAGIAAIYGASAAVAPAPAPDPDPAPAQAPPPPSTLPLAAGASLVTWPYASTAAVGAAASGQGSVTAIYGYDAGSRTWQRYVAKLPPGANTLQRLEPGEAYWFFTTRASAVRGDF